MFHKWRLVLQVLMIDGFEWIRLGPSSNIYWTGGGRRRSVERDYQTRSAKQCRGLQILLCSKSLRPHGQWWNGEVQTRSRAKSNARTRFVSSEINERSVRSSSSTSSSTFSTEEKYSAWRHSKGYLAQTMSTDAADQIASLFSPVILWSLGSSKLQTRAPNLTRAGALGFSVFSSSLPFAWS